LLLKYSSRFILILPFTSIFPDFHSFPFTLSPCSSSIFCQPLTLKHLCFRSPVWIRKCRCSSSDLVNLKSRPYCFILMTQNFYPTGELNDFFILIIGVRNNAIFYVSSILFHQGFTKANVYLFLKI
jgi:hypothetical protein